MRVMAAARLEAHLNTELTRLPDFLDDWLNAARDRLEGFNHIQLVNILLALRELGAQRNPDNFQPFLAAWRLMPLEIE